MAGFRIEGNTSGNVAEVDSANHVKVNLNTNEATAGFAAITSEVDAGTATGSRLLKSCEVTEDYRLRVGMDTLLFNDQFPGAAINTTVWLQASSTATITVAGGLLNLNAGASTASGAVARVQTYQHFPTIGTFPLAVQMITQFPFTPQANNVTE
jgi:hypothetical protein